MYSVILPTLWIPSYVENTIKDLLKHPLIGQIVIVDNNPAQPLKDFNSTKITYLKEDENIFVNPAWNKAVNFCEYDNLLFLNDDVYTNWDILNLIHPYITPSNGMIGLGQGIQNSKSVSYNPRSFEVIPCSKRLTGYACLFFLHKSNYFTIPSQLKIHYGDDFLFLKNFNKNLKIMNWTIQGELSTTINSLKVNNVIKEDQNNWHILKNNL